MKTPSLRRLIVALAASAALGAASLADDQPPPVKFSIGRTEAHAGETAVLPVSVDTEVALSGLSMAIDFEESKLEFVNFVPPAAGVDTFGDSVVTIVFRNGDERAGNQSTEGWSTIRGRARAGVEGSSA